MAKADDDIGTIQALIARQFASLSWAPGRSADWEAFAADFLPGASLYPAARPAQRRTLDGFLERMQGLAKTTLPSFQESLLGTEVRVFGNVAVALAACEMIEHDAARSRGIEALLLIKDGGAWRIVAQAWDKESAAMPIPEHLAGARGRI